MSPRFLILGSSGFMGHNLAMHLLSRGYEVAGLDLQGSNIKSENYTHVCGNAADADCLREILRTSDVVVDLASSVKPIAANKLKDEFFSSLVENALVLAKTCKEKKVGKLVYVSTAGEMYGNADTPASEDKTDPLSSYGFGKLAAEHLFQDELKSSSVKFVVARVSNPFGNQKTQNHGFVDVAIKKALAGEMLEIWGTDEIIRDYIHIGDVCVAIETLATTDCQRHVYNICSGSHYTLAAIVRLINKNLKTNKLSFTIRPDHKVDILSSRPSPSRITDEFAWKPAMLLPDYIQNRLT